MKIHYEYTFDTFIYEYLFIISELKAHKGGKKICQIETELDLTEKDHEQEDRWDLAKVLNQQDVELEEAKIKELDEASEDKLLKIRSSFFFILLNIH
jgi:hypothetical protein